MQKAGKLLKFRLFSRFAFFRTRFSFKGIETYPLPTPSSIIGLLYTACGRKWKGEIFEVSIQGYFEGSIEDFRWHRSVEFNGKSIDRYVLRLPLLLNLEVVVHVKSQDSDMLDYFLDGLLKPRSILRLGEFPTHVHSANYVEFEEKKVDFLTIPYDAWVPEDINRGFKRGSKGIYFKLPTFWSSADKPRDFIYTGYYYHTKGSFLHGGGLFFDEEGLPVWL